MTDQEQSLEDRLGVALADETASASGLAALVAECEQAIDEIESDWEAAFDVRRWPDAKEALAHREGCAFRSDRLKSLLPELRQRHQQAAEAEQLAEWMLDADRLEAERDALAQKWTETYPALVDKLIELLTETAALEQKISALHQRRQAGVSRHLSGPEVTARRLERFDRGHPPIPDRLVLPDWINSARTVWPPPPQRDFSVLAVPHHPQFSPDWSSPEVLAAREEAARADRERAAKYAEWQTRVQEERVNREERERFARRKG
jgi:hypothetical protein